MHNQDINSLIGAVKEAEQGGDKLDNVIIGDLPYLIGLSKKTDGHGHYLYPELWEYRNQVASGTPRKDGPSLALTQDLTGIDIDEDGGDDDDDEFTDDDEFKYGDYEDDVYDDAPQQQPSGYG